jgi:hypothetical protein
MTKFWTSTGDLLLIFAAVAGSLGAVITAFEIPVVLLNLLLFWGICALWAAFGVNFLRLKGILIVLFLLTALVLWRYSEIIEGGKYVIYTITSAYNEWTYIPILFEGTGAAGFSSTVFFAAAGLLLSIPLSAAVCLRRSLPIMVLLTAPLLISTFLLFNTRADVRFLLLLLVSCFALLINGSLLAAGRNFSGRTAFPAILLSIVLLTTAGLFAPHHEDLNETVLEWSRWARDQMTNFGVSIERYQSDGRSGIPAVWRFDTTHSPIADSGSRVIAYQELLEIEVSEPGIHYLRGFSMEYFDGRTWHSNPVERPVGFETPSWSQTFMVPMLSSFLHVEGFLETDLDSPDGFREVVVTPIIREPFRTGEMTVRQTGDVTENVVYMPYFAIYSMEIYPYTTTFFMMDHPISAISAHDRGRVYNMLSTYNHWMQSHHEIYTQIDPSTASALRQIATSAGIDIFSSDREAIANQIMAFVSSAADYTLTPAPIPAHEDFALYFLQSSRQGFCIHFATTAVLMLRALDIPARFVTGFTASIRPHEVNSAVSLTDRHAHAWAEVYFSDFGWKPFEATPPDIGFGFTQDLPPGMGGTDYDSLRDHSGEEFFMDNGLMHYTNGFTPYYWEDMWLENGHQPPRAGFTATATEEAAPNVLLRTLLIAAIFAAILIIRRAVTVRMRKKRFVQDNPNKAAIYIWKYISRFKRGKEIPARIEDIALEARFSQNIITEISRANITAFSFDTREWVFQRANLPRRVWLKYILCL